MFHRPMRRQLWDMWSCNLKPLGVPAPSPGGDSVSGFISAIILTFMLRNMFIFRIEVFFAALKEVCYLSEAVEMFAFISF